MIRWYTLSILFYCLCCICLQSHAQATDSLPAIVHIQETDNKLVFSSELRPLRQIAGAPAAFYSYYWEFGDGTFSFEKAPQHVYKDTGSYEVRLYATNNYDDGKPPPVRPRPVKIRNKSYADVVTPSGFFRTGGNVEMKVNRMPCPGEEMVLLIGYRQPAVTAAAGSLLLLYNEKQFRQDNFNWQEARTHQGEKKIPADSLWAYLQEQPLNFPGTLLAQRGPAEAEMPLMADPLRNQQVKAMVMQQMNRFRKNQVWRMENIQPGSEQFLFVSLLTTPEMLKDTNAVVNITALFIPDDPTVEPEEYVLELPVVASHDPNRMLLRNHRLNYRFTGKKKTLTYKVQFQNTGKGPASTVDVGVRIPGMLDGNSLELLDMEPRCIPCDSAYNRQSCLDTLRTKDSIHFIFRNIYLPGVQQEGVNDLDSTKGFIRYSMHFARKPSKQAFASQAAIVFDKNEPVITNRSTGRFKPGLSPGIMLGYNQRLGTARSWKLGDKAITAGVSISPYAPQHQYLQWELYAGVFNEHERFVNRREGGDTMIAGIGYKVRYRDTYERVNVITLEAVPLQLRYNLCSWIGTGAGILTAVNVNTRTRRILKTSVERQEQVTLEGELDHTQSWFTDLNPALFADVQLGRVRSGPAAGIRYIHYMHPAEQRLYFYATWKF